MRIAPVSPHSARGSDLVALMQLHTGLLDLPASQAGTAGMPVPNTMQPCAFPVSGVSAREAVLQRLRWLAMASRHTA